MAPPVATLPPPSLLNSLNSLFSQSEEFIFIEIEEEEEEQESMEKEKHSKISTKPSLFPLLTCPQVPDEAFNLFHTIDRDLFTVLVRTLNRDPDETMQIMAFFIWLEKQAANNSKLVKHLLSLPPVLLNDAANEAVRCLQAAESDQVPNPGRGIELLQGLVDNRVISLRYFHENRVSVMKGVMMILNTVCKRAFRDIVERMRQENVAETSRTAERREGVPLVTRVPPPAVMSGPFVNAPFMQLPPPGPGTGGFIQVLHQAPPPPQAVPRPVQVHAMGIPIHVRVLEGYPIYGPGQMMGNSESGAMVEQHLFLGGNSEEIVNVQDESRVGVGEEVPPEERTIFLTFSKGYPISEEEVYEFFTRKFGDFIEEIIMQEVEEGEQVLYARMVCKKPDVIDTICAGNKAKYSINGKHVWARKYVKKQAPAMASPTRARETSTSQQFSVRE